MELMTLDAGVAFLGDDSSVLISACLVRRLRGRIGCRSLSPVRLITIAPLDSSGAYHACFIVFVYEVPQVGIARRVDVGPGGLVYFG